ncbi:MAG TPA: glutamine--fructose-6-phosphate transaminase (isomerizing) [Deltaproteobacteria bacterium]|nr:MAG: glutamine--fructose-6-phosphate aminotransferase [Deltaproteobacteria bacterium GWB2_42_7]OGP42379.1 MAG: glutamine--fructose-6-phosphate aminotransferase [Deltaproteobacteria bacterium GWD2_42_10]OGP46968.1 MAG: glutamine--fructose-6-phosphate aminotransferase [Deltaproteobacteria bacterium GWF2_42_12]OGQ28587.1 MAG: glutamine--fructose-6-phosphate aminotransferase [Deltaproteobacteria bacterium RIFCSPHIGHO2_02_FULL_42_44]OGQ38454.1 MAG: glutamine--fructose-6-phosphate aminotransferase
MCGIVGYIGTKDASGVLLDGLKRLEYRGYDSAGIAIIGASKNIEVRRSVGKLFNLEKKVHSEPVNGNIGIGHTRWATHGRPSEENAHPHIEAGVAVVHNGIIENYLPLKEALKKQGAVFKSETDTEILAHLISRRMKTGKTFEDSVRETLKEVKGSFAIAVMSKEDPDKIIGARMECPLVVGIGDGEGFIASDIPAILNRTKRVIFLEDGEIVTLTKDNVQVKTVNGKEVKKTPREIDWSPVMAEKGGYRHFMLKEIFEQSRAVTDTFRGRISEETGNVILDDFKISDKDLKAVERIYLIACGTSWHAGLVGKFLIEEFCRIPSEVDLGSEFRYRNPLADKNTLVIAISQSGETADTIAAVKEAKRKGAKVISICNVVESSIARESHSVIYTHAGPEIGVASTKAFTTQLTALYLLALSLGIKLSKIKGAMTKEYIQELVRLPKKIETILSHEPKIEAIAKRYFHFRDFLYLARGINYPVALEGALKLKEISYIHAEGYTAGEMKHGPIALIDENMPVVVLAPKDATYPKILGNIEEVKARGGRVIVLVNEGDNEASQKADEIITIPSASHHLTPILLTIPLQLLAYHIAVLKGTDVDQPRNLAKSVTVE